MANRPRQPATREQPRSAFSLVEILIVVVIVAILAAVVAPRLSAITQRPARGAALALGELLTAAAQRDALTSQPLAIEFDQPSNTIALLAPARGAALDAPANATLVRDAIIQPADLGDARVVEVFADGATVDATAGFRIEFRSGAARPTITIMLSDRRDPDGVDPVVVELAADASRAVVRAVGDQGESDATDLDAMGKGEEPW
jgi:prepilin-type N-terminal cleavage/methylation domain-containing protein